MTKIHHQMLTLAEPLPSMCSRCGKEGDCKTVVNHGELQYWFCDPCAAVQQKKIDRIMLRYLGFGVCTK